MMAEQGYWMICEELYAGNKALGKPGVYMGMVEGFFDVYAMASTRLEVLSQIKKKIIHNIEFLQKCYQDIPNPSLSDCGHPDCGLPNAVHFFISLSDLNTSRNIISKRAA